MKNLKKGNMQFHNSTLLPPSAGPFSTCVFGNGFLFISGQIGLKSSGVLAENFHEEVVTVMENIGLILSEAGLSHSDIASVTIYLKDMKKFGELNDLYKKYFKEGYPARTCIAVAGLPLNANVEMTVTAALTK
jgi:2-iminobutanoate/2-iminopropanoate deaminase